MLTSQSDTDALDKHFNFSANDDQQVMDTSVTTEKEKDTSDTHEDETIVNDLPKKVKSVLGWGGKRTIKKKGLSL